MLDRGLPFLRKNIKAFVSLADHIFISIYMRNEVMNAINTNSQIAPC